MSSQNSNTPTLRRLGDIIQGLAVIAIAGLVVIVIDLRITIVQNQEMINSQERLNSQNFKSLRENIELQIKILESIVQRASQTGFHSSQGAALQESVKAISQKIEKHQIDINTIYQKIHDCAKTAKVND